jgi:hypothetical protein
VAEYRSLPVRNPLPALPSWVGAAGCRGCSAPQKVVTVASKSADASIFRALWCRITVSTV